MQKTEVKEIQEISADRYTASYKQKSFPKEYERNMKSCNKVIAPFMT